MPPPNIRTPGTVYLLNYTTLQLVLYGGVILFQDLWMFKLRAQSCYTVLKIIWQQPMLLLLRHMPSSKLKLFSKASRTVSLSRMPTESISQNLSKSPCSVSRQPLTPFSQHVSRRKLNTWRFLPREIFQRTRQHPSDFAGGRGRRRKLTSLEGTYFSRLL